VFASVRSWTEFTAACAQVTELERGTAFEHLVAHYLRRDPKYRTKLSDVWFHHEVPADLRTRLKLPPRDMGIDLVARTHTGEFWAVQAKYRTDSTAALTFSELSTFTTLAFTVCADAFTYALVCTTTARLPGILGGLANLGDLTAETWSTLPPEFFVSLAAPVITAPPPITPRPPREHQSKAIAAAVAYYAEPGQSRGKLIHPCGSGKSLTAYWIARALDARRVLIAVPSLALVRQTLETWMYKDKGFTTWPDFLHTKASTAE